MTFFPFVCVPYSPCDETEYESEPPSAFANRRCTPLKVCSALEYQTQAPTPTTDRECDTTRVCNSTEYETMAPTATSNRECASLTPCNATTQYIDVLATATSDRSCADLITCDPDTEYILQEATLTSARFCDTIARCELGEEQTQAPSPTSDRLCRICPPGFVDADRDPLTPCEECAKGTYQNQPGQTICLDGAFVCPRGTRQASNGTAASSRVCLPCDGVIEYQDLADQTSCKPVTPCPVGTIKVDEPTATRNTVCQACNGVTAYSDVEGATLCKVTRGSCSFGAFESVSPSPSTDRLCQTCDVGVNFKDVEGAAPCQNITTCPPGTAIVANATAASDQVCFKCTLQATYSDQPNLFQCEAVRQCDDVTEYELQAPTLSSDRLCGQVAVCDPGVTYRPLGVPDRCDNCSTCPEGRYVAVACSDGVDTLCQECGSCGPTQYEVQACTATTPTECANIAVCPFEEYIAQPATATSDVRCLPFRPICNTSISYEAAAPTKTSNRICAPLTICGQDSFETVPATPTSNRNCSLLTVCGADEVESTAATATSDRVCETDGVVLASRSNDNSLAGNEVAGLVAGLVLLAILALVLFIIFRPKSRVQSYDTSEESIPLQAVKPLMASKPAFWTTEELDVEILPDHKRRFRPPIRPAYRVLVNNDRPQSLYGDKSVASGPTSYHLQDGAGSEVDDNSLQDAQAEPMLVRRRDSMGRDWLAPMSRQGSGMMGTISSLPGAERPMPQGMDRRMSALFVPPGQSDLPVNDPRLASIMEGDSRLPSTLPSGNNTPRRGSHMPYEPPGTTLLPAQAFDIPTNGLPSHAEQQDHRMPHLSTTRLAVAELETGGPPPHLNPGLLLHAQGGTQPPPAMMEPAAMSPRPPRNQAFGAASQFMLENMPVQEDTML